MFALGCAARDGPSGSLVASSSTPTTYSRRSTSGLAAPSVFLRSSSKLSRAMSTACLVCCAVSPARAGRPLRGGPGTDADHPQRGGDRYGHRGRRIIYTLLG